MAIAHRPAYLANGGVLSMLATLMLGERAKRALLRVLRRSSCPE